MFAPKQLSLQLTPHDYQYLVLNDAISFVDDECTPGARRLYASPTGTGKSVMELMVLGFDPHAVLVTPRLEIVAGMLQKGGVDTASLSDDKLAALALEYRITTPVRFRNMLAKGVFPFRPARVILDEAHHALADTYTELKAYLPEAQWIGFTATPYRGTPQQTAEFHEQWGGVTQVLSMRQAVDRGCIALPVPEVWPLLDDDMIEVRNGELHVAAVESETSNLIQAVVERCRRFVTAGAARLTDLRTTPPNEFGDYTVTATWNPARWTRPTMFSVATTNVCRLLTGALNEAGLPAELVTQDTPRVERNRIFAAAMRCEIALVQIDVVSEGVDLPFRRLIDLRPTLSPVKWMQQLGRITRPLKLGESPAEYYTVNRNLERHGYLFDGAMPAKYIKAAQDAFENPTRRAAQRAFGLETIGRFSAAEVPLVGGLRAHAYFLTATDQFARQEYAAVVSPLSTEILYATRRSERGEEGEFKYGSWQQLDALPADLRGYKSAESKALSPKQAAWWARDGARFGLDPLAVVTRKSFPVLPLLKDLRFRLRGE